MYTFIAGCSGFVAFVLFIFCGANQFRDTALFISFISWLFNTIVFASFASLKKTVSQQGEEIEKLKTHLGIKDGDPVNQNNENKND